MAGIIVSIQDYYEYPRSLLLTFTVLFRFIVVCQGVSHLNNLTTENVTCYLDYSCSLLNCCISVEKIDRSMSVQLKFDQCTQKLTVNLERVKIEVDLLSFEYGRNYFDFCVLKLVRFRITYA